MRGNSRGENCAQYPPRPRSASASAAGPGSRRRPEALGGRRAAGSSGRWWERRGRPRAASLRFAAAAIAVEATGNGSNCADGCVAVPLAVVASTGSLSRVPSPEGPGIGGPAGLHTSLRHLPWEKHSGASPKNTQHQNIHHTTPNSQQHFEHAYRKRDDDKAF